MLSILGKLNHVQQRAKIEIEIANERAVGPILQFLRNTEVGSRDGTRERELEWQRRSDQEGENQLTD